MGVGGSGAEGTDRRPPAGRRVVGRVGRLPLIGRAAEPAALRAECAAAFGGEPRAVFLVGEAGIGKSRLVAEVAAATRARARSSGRLSP